MSDDLDDLLRRAMKSLDDQVPPGYFDDFSSQTLARLADGSSMDDEPTDAPLAASSSDALAATPPAQAPPAQAPPVAAAPAPAPAEPAPVKPREEREEDSGLHDIRNLASSQRMRISSRRSSRHSSPAIGVDDDVLASASGSWRAVALPEPAKMVSLPELSELPPAREVQEAERAAARPAPREGKQKIPEAAPAAPREAAAAVEPPAVTPIAAARAAKPAKPAKPAPAAGGRGGRNALIAIAGLGLAAAAGGVVFVSTQGQDKQAAMEPSAPAQRVATPMPELRQVVPPAPAVIAAPAPAAAGAGSAAIEPKADAAAEKVRAAPPPEKPGKSAGKYVPNVVEDDPKPPAKPKPEEPKKQPDPGDPDFDKLLKEAGYQAKKTEGPKLEKKSLSGDDIKKSMNGVAAKVSACYDGQQGTASVKLTVAPTGQIQRVAVSGVFAGTPVGACVEAAVQGASFPPWDGGPQSVNYSYLLAE